MSAVRLKSFICVLSVAVLSGASARAKELEVLGQAAVEIPLPPPQVKGAPPVPPDFQSLRAYALGAAKRQALIAAVDKVLGPGASRDPRVAAKLDAVQAQVSDEALVDTKSARVGNSYEVRIKLVLDDKEFRTLLSDLGIAINTAAVRGYSILSVMDEFITSPRDLKAPLEELEEFSSDKGGTFSDRSKASASSASAADLSLKVKQDSLTASRTATSRADVIVDVAAEQHDVQRYRKLVRYQPQGGPEQTSQTYNALMGQLQDYDLRVLDNDVFKSKYFKETPLTIAAMQNGEALSKYVSFAKSDANADFFMVGNSIILDSGKNPNTGDLECTALVTVKTYSTVDGEAIASETFAEASTGRNLNDCAGLAAKKVARIGGPILGARVQEYWKRRATYGREQLVTLVGSSLPLMLRSAFTRAVRSVPGVEGDNQRVATSTRLQLVVTYKGTDPLDQALAMQLASNPAFATLDARAEGNQFIFCLGPCAEVEKKLKESTP